MTVNEGTVSVKCSNEGGAMPGPASGDGDATRLDTIAERHEEDGFCFPIRAISRTEAAVHLARVVEMEKAGEGQEPFSCVASASRLPFHR